jgi:cytoskeletal protein RodZ
MASIGETLRGARHNMKASLEDASRATKIKVEVLEKLEADDFRPLGAPMYVKGFLKLYAEYLGLDGRLIAETYLTSQGGLRRQGLRLETQATLMEERQNELRLPIGAVMAAVAGISLLLLVWWGVRQWQAHRAAPPKVVALPRVNIDPIYQIKTMPVAQTLEP